MYNSDKFESYKYIFPLFAQQALVRFVLVLQHSIAICCGAETYRSVCQEGEEWSLRSYLNEKPR